MRIAFLGTPAIAVPALEGLIGNGHQVVVVVTRPDTRRGRGGATSPSPVKAVALEHGIPVVSAAAELIDLADSIDLGVVVAYGRIITTDVLDAVPMINIHFSLLPRWRGAAPVERALLAGDRTTGVCLMQVVAELDAGDVYACREVEIAERETAERLRRRLADLGATMLIDLLAGELPAPTPQTGESTYADKITTDDLRINWQSDPARIDRQVRVGGAWTTFRGRRIKILECEPPGSGSRPVPLRVQPEGRPAMSYRDWLNGIGPIGDEWFT